MKRYLLFAGQSYYPGGGWDDFVWHFNNYLEAHHYGLCLTKDHVFFKQEDWFHVVDSTILQEVTS